MPAFFWSVGGATSSPRPPRKPPLCLRVRRVIRGWIYFLGLGALLLLSLGCGVTLGQDQIVSGHLAPGEVQIFRLPNYAHAPAEGGVELYFAPAGIFSPCAPPAALSVFNRSGEALPSDETCALVEAPMQRGEAWEVEIAGPPEGADYNLVVRVAPKEGR